MKSLLQQFICVHCAFCRCPNHGCGRPAKSSMRSFLSEAAAVKSSLSLDSTAAACHLHKVETHMMSATVSTLCSLDRFTFVRIRVHITVHKLTTSLVLMAVFFLCLIQKKRFFGQDALPVSHPTNSVSDNVTIWQLLSQDGYEKL